jgi:CubicO group peptidase (beta-lactamase class C family)
MMEIYKPESVGIDSQRLARLDKVMQEYVKDDQLPGILTLVQRHGKVVQLGKYGHVDIAAKKPIHEDALFRIYSMTKPITSVALMTLFEEGHFSLKDPVSKFIPAFKHTKVYAGSEVLGMKLVEQNPPMTLYHLLTHTAGLSYGWFFDSPVEELYRQAGESMFQRGQTLAENIDTLAQLPLLFQPGTQWRYSFATDVIGRVIEVVADMPLGDFYAERIFKPLGMVDTAFQVPPEKCHRLAPLYVSEALYNPVEATPEQVLLIGDVTTHTKCPTGGAGLVSTLADYLAFCNCLLNNGAYEGGRLLGRKTVAWMTANHIPAAWMPIKVGTDVLDHGFGLGFRVATSLGEARALTSIGEFGWGGAAQTFFWIDPAEQFVGLMMTQLLPVEPYPVQERFRNLAYQAILN